MTTGLARFLSRYPLPCEGQHPVRFQQCGRKPSRWGYLFVVLLAAAIITLPLLAGCGG